MRVFISYASSNRELVSSLAQDIERLGHDTWFDQELTGGHHWWTAILDQLEACDVFIFALTPESLDSFPCRLEWEYAAALNKPILPVMIVTVNPELLPPALTVINFLDYRHKGEDRVFGLARAIQTLPAPVPLPEPLPARPPVPISDIGRLKEKVESSAELTEGEQSSLVLDLKRFLGQPRYADDARLILLRLQQRRDTRAYIYQEIAPLLVGEAALAPSAPPSVARAASPAAAQHIAPSARTMTHGERVMSWLGQWAVTTALLFLTVLSVLSLDIYAQPIDQDTLSISDYLRDVKQIAHQHVALGTMLASFSAVALVMTAIARLGRQRSAGWQSLVLSLSALAAALGWAITTAYSDMYEILWQFSRDTYTVMTFVVAAVISLVYIAVLHARTKDRILVSCIVLGLALLVLAYSHLGLAAPDFENSGFVRPFFIESFRSYPFASNFDLYNPFYLGLSAVFFLNAFISLVLVALYNRHMRRVLHGDAA